MEGLVEPSQSDFWHGKRVLLTGHTGFKGVWLAIWLRRLGATIVGVALPPSTTPNLFELVRLSDEVDSHFLDIREADTLAAVVRKASPDIVFHMAAQPLVRAGYDRPLDTFETNVMGTAHLLDALRGVHVLRVSIMVTTDKVYQNLEHPFPYRENDALGGHDPYSASKAASEIVAASYRDAFLSEQGVSVATARAGNVIGGGDWSKDRLIPDLIRSWQANKAVQIRHPRAVRPWQHVLDSLAGYLMLAERLWHAPTLAGAYNIGPPSHEVETVRDVVEHARAAWGDGDVVYGDDTEGPHEATLLTLETAKARAAIGLRPK